MSHTDDLRNVNERDELRVHTNEGEVLSLVCTDRSMERADPTTGEVRETTIWTFDSEHGEMVASIIDGLKSSPTDPDFPQHTQLYSMEADEKRGFIERVELLGQVSR